VGAVLGEEVSDGSRSINAKEAHGNVAVQMVSHEEQGWRIGAPAPDQALAGWS
jgi:hypothetical protein